MPRNLAKEIALSRPAFKGLDWKALAKHLLVWGRWRQRGGCSVPEFKTSFWKCFTASRCIKCQWCCLSPWLEKSQMRNGEKQESWSSRALITAAPEGSICLLAEQQGRARGLVHSPAGQQLAMENTRALTQSCS